jgi:hypothetical protein
MTKYIYKINKRALTKEERESVSRNYRGFRALADTITEEIRGDDGRFICACTYYIYVGRWTPYGACVKHGDRYVFARYSRYDSLTTDLTDFALDCDELGGDDKVFETKHFKVENGIAITKKEG